MNDTEFKVGDLVEFVRRSDHWKTDMTTGLIIGFKELSDWDVGSSNLKKVTAVVVLWNNGAETNTSPLVLNKL